jgi:hypothetical protein
MTVERDPTCIGRVRHVLGATITVALDNDLAGIAPIYQGRILSVGQIGSLVRIPQGLVDLVASVSLVGIAELTGQLEPASAVQRDERWLQVQLLGQIDLATGKFERGVASYPGLDDPVHFATPDHLRCVFPPAGEHHLRIGSLASSEDLAICLDVGKLVMRHGAVVGSTGSGKTSAVASILQNLVNGGWSNANVVVIDPHGEYSKALQGHAAVRSVLGQGEAKLRMPFWALPALDVLKIFAGSPGGGTFSNRFCELVTLAKKKFAQDAIWLALDVSSITADTPIPYDLREIWHKLDFENRETRTIKIDPDTACVVDPGNAAELRAATFQTYSQGSQGPHKSPIFDTFGLMPALLRLGLLDPRLACFLEPPGTVDGPDPLISVVQEWLGTTKPISVLDFAGVPPLATDLAVGVILNMLFELAVRSEHEGPGIGRPGPVLVVLEEAHRYLGESASAMTKAAANRISREGRKYGMGLLLVTQRPTELPDTALSQCGTLIALRLTNSGDQGAIKSTLPDNVAGLAAVLPSLRTGEAIVSGEALVLPVRVLLDRPNPAPLAGDPLLTPWRLDPELPDISKPLNLWRGMNQENADD